MKPIEDSYDSGYEYGYADAKAKLPTREQIAEGIMTDRDHTMPVPVSVLTVQLPASLPTREQIAQALHDASCEADEAEASWSELMLILADTVLALLQKGGDDTHAVSDDYWDGADRD